MRLELTATILIAFAIACMLFKLLGAFDATTHTHHQCVKKLGKGLVATQWDARDGHIKAIEHTEQPVYGLQWYPEEIGFRGTRVAKFFIAICSKYGTPRK